MANKIFGQIINTIDESKPLPKIRIRAWDDDWPDGDDLLGEDLTDQNGDYKILCMGNIYDKSILGQPSMYPDIYITTDIKNVTDQWVRFGRSQVFKNYNLSKDLLLNLTVKIEPAIQNSTSFISEDHGFQFNNSFKFRPDFLNIEFKEMGLGFCGGMCATALNRFNKNEEIPDTKLIPEQGSDLYEELMDRQIKSMPPQVLIKMYKFQSAPDKIMSLRKPSIGMLTKKEWSKLKAHLDYGNPTILILIRAKGLYGNPTKNHQVLAIGYKYDPTRKDLEILVYDPNKKKETHSLMMSLALPDGILHFRDSTGKRTRGFFVNDAGESASD